MNFNELSQIIDAYYDFTGSAALKKISAEERRQACTEDFSPCTSHQKMLINVANKPDGRVGHK